MNDLNNNIQLLVGYLNKIDGNFNLYFEHVRSLQFDESPKYEYLKDIFKGLMKKHEFKNDYNYFYNIIIFISLYLKNNIYIKF